MGASWLYFRFLAPVLADDPNYVPNIWGASIYGLVLGVVGLLGDLCESLVKRDVQRKDSSRWLPGLGGVLDVVDSPLFALPAAYFCLSHGLVGPRQ